MVEQDRKDAAAKKEEDRASLTRRAKAMKDAGYSNESIGRAFKMAESSVRTLLKES